MKTITLILLFSFSLSFAQSGKEGSATITSTRVVNEYTDLTVDAIAGSTTLTVSQSILNANNRFPSSLSAGDLVLIVQVQGATIDYSNSVSYGTVNSYNTCGLFELAQVKSVSANNIELKCPLKNSYSYKGKTQVVRVPRYTSLKVTSSGKIKGDLWNGIYGGVIAVEVMGNCTVDGVIDASAIGFRGGNYDNNTSNDFANPHTEYVSPNSSLGGEKGEGVAGYYAEYDANGGRYSRGAPANGGGGGNAHNAGGGGGANGGDLSLWTGKGNPDISTASWISAWNLEGAAFANSSSSGGGRGGYTYASSTQDPLIIGPSNNLWGGDHRKNVGGFGGRPLTHTAMRVFMGGGGGAGDGNNNASSGGGKGGGLAFLFNYGNVNGTGSIVANGEDAPNTKPSHNDAPGGGGGGGSVIIQCNNSLSGISILCKGGKGGNQLITQTENEGPGGGGGGGYIGVSSNTLSIVNVMGGVNGTTSSPSVKKFIPNGATSGGAGTIDVFPALPTVELNVKDDTACSGNQVVLSAKEKGSNGNNVEWFTLPQGGTPVYKGENYSFILQNNICYYVEVCGMFARDTVCAVSLNQVNFDLGKNIDTCESAIIKIGVPTHVGYSYLWNTLETTNYIDVKQSETYSLTVNAGSCVSVDSIKVTFYPYPKIKVSNDTTVCEGHAVVFSVEGTNVNQILWSTDQFTLQISVATAGLYTVEVKNALGCSVSDSVVLKLNKNPKSFLPEKIEYCFNEGTLLLNPNVQGKHDFLWNTTEKSATIEVRKEGLYTVKVIDTTGCWVNDTTSIIEICPFTIFIPNAFSPNNDGVNDFFLPVGTDIPTDDYHFFIFDRWGEMIFETSTLGYAWNGKRDNNMREAQIDVYVWKLIYYDTIKKEKVIAYGRVSLVR